MPGPSRTYFRRSTTQNLVSLAAVFWMWGGLRDIQKTAANETTQNSARSGGTDKKESPWRLLELIILDLFKIKVRKIKVLSVSTGLKPAQ